MLKSKLLISHLLLLCFEYDVFPAGNIYPVPCSVLALSDCSSLAKLLSNELCHWGFGTGQSLSLTKDKLS